MSCEIANPLIVFKFNQKMSQLIFPIFLLFIFALSHASGFSQGQISAFARAQLRLKAEARVEEINKSQRKWTAKFNPRFAEMTEAEFRAMLGVPLNGSAQFGHPNGLKESKAMDLAGWRAMMGGGFREAKGDGEMPKEFNALQKWPECRQIIAKIQDQSSCGSCWAVSSASVIQDRICIASGGKQKIEVSAQDVMSCTAEMTGCNGGYPAWAFEYYRKAGVCTGSQFHKDRPLPEYGCKPYPYPPHGNVMFPTPRCERECENPEYKNRYNEDRHFGKKTFYLEKAHENDIKLAIMEGGPVVASMIAYSDLHYYHSGVYEHSMGAEQRGGHAVRIIGWGEDEGTPYWLAANSWNTDWGEQGMFKIVRGKDECKIESWGIAFGLPDLK